MGEHQVVAAAVQVEAVAEQAQAHGDALDVPAGPARAPRRRPGRLARLGRLPQGEVERVFFGFVHLHPGPGPRAEVVEAAMHQVAVAGDLPDPQVHPRGRGIGLAPGHQALHEVDHLVHPLGGPGALVGGQHAERLHGLDVDRVPPGGQLGLGEALPVGPLDDLVVDVGDVGHVMHVEPPPLEVAAEDVVGESPAGVAQVGLVVHGGPAGVDRHPPRLPQLQGPDLAGEGVVQRDHGDGTGVGGRSSSIPHRRPSSRSAAGADPPSPSLVLPPLPSPPSLVRLAPSPPP